MTNEKKDDDPDPVIKDLGTINLDNVHNGAQAKLKNADCRTPGDGVTNEDALAIQKYKLELINSLPEMN